MPKIHTFVVHPDEWFVWNQMLEADKELIMPRAIVFVPEEKGRYDVYEFMSDGSIKVSKRWGIALKKRKKMLHWIEV